MLSPSWESSPGALLGLLHGTAAAELRMADLYTFTLAGGQVLRYTSADVPVTLGGLTWQLGPVLRRSRIKRSVGITVDELTLTLSAGPAVTVAGTPLIAYVTRGGLADAAVLLERLFGGADGMPVGTVISFSGRVGDVAGGRHEKTLTVQSDTALLDVMIPRDVYQPGCKNTLFDAACGLARGPYVVASTAAGPSGAARTSVPHTLSQPAGYFNLGVMRFTSGANTGVARTVRSHLSGLPSGLLVALQPWPFVVAGGDAFTVTPGCDKTLDTCTGKFANRGRFRGEPFIPAPDTVI